MSNEVKSKEKLDMDPKYLAVLTATLFITCVIVAAALGYVNKLTAPNIAEANRLKTEAAMMDVVEDKASTFSPDPTEITEAMAAAAGGYKGTLVSVTQVLSGGQDAGYAVKVVAGGSQGKIEMMVGVDLDGAVTGVSIVKHAETKGIGSKVMGNENGVLDQFIGTSHTAGDLVVGSNVDAITGATVSTKGVTAGVNAALAAVAAIG